MEDNDPMKGRIYKTQGGRVCVVMSDMAINNNGTLVVIMQYIDSTSGIGVCCDVNRLESTHQRLA